MASGGASSARHTRVLMGVTWLTTTAVECWWALMSRSMAPSTRNATTAKLSPPGGAASGLASQAASSSGQRWLASANDNPCHCPKSASARSSSTIIGAPVASATASAERRARCSGEVTMTSSPGAAASLRAASPACLMPSLVSAMSSRPENLRSADSSVAPWRSSSVVVGLPAAFSQPGAAPPERRRAHAAVLRPQLVVQFEQVRRDGGGDFDSAVACLDRLLGEFGERRVPGGGDVDELALELLALGCRLLQGDLRRLAALHHREHDFLEVGLPPVQRLHLGLQVLELARRADHAVVQPLAIAIDPRPDLVHVGLGLGLLAFEIAVLRGQRGDGISELAVASLQPGECGVLGKAAEPVLDPAKLRIDVC